MLRNVGGYRFGDEAVATAEARLWFGRGIVLGVHGNAYQANSITVRPAVRALLKFCQLFGLLGTGSSAAGMVRRRLYGPAPERQGPFADQL